MLDDVLLLAHLLMTDALLLFIWVGVMGAHLSHVSWVHLAPPHSSTSKTPPKERLAGVLTRHLDHPHLLLSTWRWRCHNTGCVHTFQIFIPNYQCYPQYPGENTCKPYLHQKIPLPIPMPDWEAGFRLTKRISKAFSTASEILFEAAAQLKIKYINLCVGGDDSRNEWIVPGEQHLSCCKYAFK